MKNNQKQNCDLAVNSRLEYATKNGERIAYIDAIRGFAILCVVIGHIPNVYTGRGGVDKCECCQCIA